MAIYKRTIRNRTGKDTEYWYLEVSIEGGKKIKRSVGKVGYVTKTMARQREQELIKKIKLEQLDMIRAEIPTLKDFSENYICFKRDIDNKRSWIRDKELLYPLISLFGNKKLSDIKVKDIEEFKSKRIKEVKASTVNRSLSVLRHLFNLAKKWEKYYGDNPVSTAGLLEENNLIERILTTEEEIRLLDNSAAHLKIVIITALNTGMRIGEIVSLRWEEVDLENNIITITQKNSKSKKERKLHVNPILRPILVELRLKAGSKEHVFLNIKGEKINKIRTAFKGACRRAGLTGIRFHDLRHTAATRMVESDINIVAVSKILGHSDIKTTMRYAHPEDSLRKALESLGNFGKVTTKIATNGISTKGNDSVTSRNY